MFLNIFWGFKMGNIVFDPDKENIFFLLFTSFLAFEIRKENIPPVGSESIKKKTLTRSILELGSWNELAQHGFFLFEKSLHPRRVHGLTSCSLSAGNTAPVWQLMGEQLLQLWLLHMGKFKALLRHAYCLMPIA